jgi:hypothetical protein
MESEATGCKSIMPFVADRNDDATPNDEVMARTTTIGSRLTDRLGVMS